MFFKPPAAGIVPACSPRLEEPILLASDSPRTEKKKEKSRKSMRTRKSDNGFRLRTARNGPIPRGLHGVGLVGSELALWIGEVVGVDDVVFLFFSVGVGWGLEGKKREKKMRIASVRIRTLI